MFNHNFYLHFATDLKRAAMALFNKNGETAKTFLEHAHKIFSEKLLPDNVNEKMASNFTNSWAELYSKPIPADNETQKRFADELVTMSSLVFLRATRLQMGLQKLDGVAKQVDTPVKPDLIPTVQAEHIPTIPAKISLKS